MYSNTALTSEGGTIFDTDEITVNTITDKYCKVTYPVSGGTKTGYIRTSAILLKTTGSSYTASKKVTTYKRPGGAQYGSISKGDKVTKLGTKGDYTQVKYPVSGGYKYAFIRNASSTKATASKATSSTKKPSSSKKTNNTNNGKSIVLKGVKLGYKFGDYFTDNGKQCTQKTCPYHKNHNHPSGYDEDEKICNCKCTAKINGKTYKLGGIQCIAFARYCQSALYRANDSQNPSKFKTVSKSKVAPGKLTKGKIETLVKKAGIGGHIRTQGKAHSMIISKVTSSGFTVIQCNGSNNANYSGYFKCRIGYKTYTWSSYVKSTYGKRGLAYIKVKR